MEININCDLGEKSKHHSDENDPKLLEIVNSANVACGYHAGDEDSMNQVVKICKKNGVSIGAHPSFNDPENFGRKRLNLSSDEINKLLIDQYEILQNIAEKHGEIVTHIKPHGALNNMACKDPELAQVIVSYVKQHYPELIILAPVLSELAKASQDAGLVTALEVFADRTYEDDGTLTPRSIEGSLITDPSQASDHVKKMIEEKSIISRSGKRLPTTFHSICLHSDTPNSVEISNQICILLHSMEVQQLTLPELF